jgi:hypothetical protein
LLTSPFHHIRFSHRAYDFLFKDCSLTVWCAGRLGWSFIGMFFADSNLFMGITLKMAIQSGETNRMIAGADYSLYTLQQLLEARYWFNADRDPNRGRRLDEEIQKRCARFQAPTRRKGSATGTGNRYRPYGLMFGVFFLVVSSGPFIAVEFLDTMNIITDVNGDNALLSGAWALLTLPFAVMVFMIGGIMDAERVVKWFRL